jgi:hypothetical protein
VTEGSVPHALDSCRSNFNILLSETGAVRFQDENLTGFIFIKNSVEDEIHINVLDFSLLQLDPNNHNNPLVDFSNITVNCSAS